MRRTNAAEVVVEAPDRGLVTSVPSDLPDKARNRAIVVAKNVRAEYGVLRAAPGYERVLFNPKNLDSAPNLIFQANILNNDPEIKTTPIIGTASKLFTLLRRAKELTCDATGNACSLTAAFFGDSGRVGADLDAVATLVRGWTPDIIVHTGDLVYADGGITPLISDFEEVVGGWFFDYIGGYNGYCGVGPSVNKFFPVLGNHDWDDGGLANYIDFFQLPLNPNERYYHYKRGPVHFIHLSGYEAEEPDGVAEDSVQGAWAQEVLENSDCPWRIVVVHFPPYTSDVTHYPGTTALRWPFKEWGASAVVSGHAHNAEVVKVDGLYYFITGTGGHSLRGFNATPVTGSEFRYNAAYGALKLEATRTQLTWKYYNTSGALLHTVEMTDPKESSGICYVGDASRSLVNLEIRPANAAVEVGFSWPFDAYAHYTDGSVDNVTLQALWSSSNVAIASVGETTGVSTGVSPGTIVITAEFEGETATANLTVLHSCLDDPMEVCFAVERSESTGSTASGASRLQHIKDGLDLCAGGFVEGRDYLSLVSFAGTFADQTEDVTTDQLLTTDFEDFSDKVAVLSPAGTGSSVAEALSAAYTELTSSRHDAARRRAVVLIVDGAADVTNPGGDPSSEAAAIAAATAAADTIADTIKAAGIKLVVVGYAVREAHQAALGALATEGYDWFVSTADELKSTLSLLANSFCFADGYYYSYVGDTPNCFSAQQDYHDWINWEVTAGSTDLCGQGENGAAFYDVLPGNGLYMDLAGTDRDESVSVGGALNGTIRSRTTYSFTAGKEYKLSFYMAGWNVGLPATGREFTAQVSIENVLAAQTITITDRLQPFTLYSYTFTPASNQTGRIIIRQLNEYVSVGLLLDRVRLENVTDSTTMLYDDFDSENPCP